jgi:N-acyl-L-homoserine lactone synthetase/2-polyprenyl-3-methyl-5-hydroxy-6-metoxy-1,4-benzoquinol methylase
MTSAIEMLREDETEELWQKCCGFGELSLEDFCAYVCNSLPRSCDQCHGLVTDVFVSLGSSSNKASRILCIGLGSGDFSIELGREGYKVGNPDFYRAALVKARLRKNNVLLKNLEFREWDMGKGLTLYPESVFDCVVSVHTLHFLKEPEIPIREYFRVLKPSGGVILAEPRRTSKLYHILDLNEKQLKSKLDAAGFRINSITSVDSELIATALKPRYYFEANGYKFVSAETKEDLAKVFKLRYQVYCVELGVEPGNDSGLHVDEYDEYAVHFLALDDNNIPVGTLRALPNNSKGFPMESDFPLTAYMSKKGISRAVEGGRFAIKKTLSTEARAIVGFGLMKGLIDYCRETGINDLFTTTQVKIVKRFAVTGFRQIGEPFEYPGTWAGVLWVPMHCDIREVYENYCGTVQGYSDLP